MSGNAMRNGSRWINLSSVLAILYVDKTVFSRECGEEARVVHIFISIERITDGLINGTRARINATLEAYFFPPPELMRQQIRI